jgi:hypothetical protein
MDKNLTRLKNLVRLLKNEEFIRDSHAYYRARYEYVGSGLQEEWDRRRPQFLIDVHDHFVKKWGATPPGVVLLTSPIHYRKYYAITTGQWGLICVYPWTSQDEVEKQVQEIHTAIGKRGKDFVSDRNIHVADWLSQQTMPKGTRPSTDEIASVVWNQKQGSHCDSDEADEALWKKEQALMRRYRAKGKAYSEAEKLVKAATRRAELPTSEKTRKALARLKQDKSNLESLKEPRKGTTPLAFAVTRLIRQLPPLSPSPDPQRILARASFLARLLNSL